MEYKEGDLVLCTVDSVENTICFVHLPDGTKGTIISSEIAPGRIKFMRNYVVANKKIVCKILRVAGDHIDLSLRRVNAKEKKEIMQEYKQKLAIKVALKQILKEDYKEVKEKIDNDFSNLIEFIEKAREEPKFLDDYIPKDKIEQVRKTTSKKQKEVELRYSINIKCFAEDGIKKIKKILDFEKENIKSSYNSAGKYTLRIKSTDYKKAKHEAHDILFELEKKAKEMNADIEYKEEKH